MQPNPLKVGARIRSIRKSLGVNQKDFAKLVNATVPAVSNWENGRNLPNNERLKVIAKLDNISVDELLYGNKEDYIRGIIQEFCEDNGLLVNEKALKKTLFAHTYTAELMKYYEPSEFIISFYGISMDENVKDFTLQDLYLNSIALKIELKKKIDNHELPDNEQSRELIEKSEKKSNEILDSMSKDDINKLLKTLKGHSSIN